VALLMLDRNRLMGHEKAHSDFFSSGHEREGGGGDRRVNAGVIEEVLCIEGAPAEWEGGGG
jgi:hypothetical protein